MGAAIIPLIAGIAPGIIQLIASLTHQAAPVAQATLGTGTGPIKLATVFSTVIQQLQSAAAAGTIPKELPPDQTVQLIIQSVVSSMKLSGLLDQTTQPAAPQGTQDVVLHAGQSLRITVT